MLVLSDRSKAEFKAEYLAHVDGAAREIGPVEGVDYRHGSHIEYDRTAEYEFAARHGRLGLSRSAVEFTLLDSYFGLYAGDFFSRYAIVPVDAPGHGSTTAAWKDAIGRAPLLECRAAFPLGDEKSSCFDTAFFFRVMENLEADRTFLDNVRSLMRPCGVIIFSVAFSHLGSKPYDEASGFRVYDQPGLDLLLTGLEVTAFETLEGADEIAASPRLFDMTVACVAARVG